MAESRVLHDDINGTEIELDLTRSPLKRPELELDMESTLQPKTWKQVTAQEVFGEVDPTRPKKELQPMMDEPVLPSIEEFKVAKLAESLNYKGQLTPGALEDAAVFHIRRSAESLLEAGKALLLFKECVGHGNFASRLKERGIAERTARRYMQVADKYGKTATMADLAMQINQANKLLEMTYFFEDEELETLAKGGDVEGIDVEKIKSLSAPKIKELLKSRIESEKKPLEEKVSSLEKQVENHEKSFAKLQAEKEVVDSKLTQITTKKQPGKDLVSIETQAVREEAFALEYGARVYIDSLRALYRKTLNDRVSTDEDHELQVNSISIAVSNALANIDELFQELQQTSGVEIPPALSGKHVLTPEERERLEDCKAMIDHKLAVDTAMREAKREQENKRSAGRPAGSLNKAK